MTEICELKAFLEDNYGTNNPKVGNIFSLSNIKITGDLEPQLFGCKLGKISFSQRENDPSFASELNAITDKIISHVKVAAEMSEIKKIFLHFDELDRGITILSDSRKDMIIGLILASKSIAKELKGGISYFKSVVYLRRDIWDELKLSDKNKISSSNSEFIEWDKEQLHGLIEKRISVLLGEGCSWDFIDDGKKINRQPKWKHIIERTLMRPRDVISFLNLLLETSKKRKDEHLVFQNKDVVDTRPKYSEYLKKELDDEILTHWQDWDLSLQVLSRNGRVYFTKDEYITAYDNSNPKSEKTYTGDSSLEQLYNFSVIEYEARSGYGGSGWKSKFANPELGWDSNATKFKVHFGLKEYMKLK